MRKLNILILLLSLKIFSFGQTKAIFNDSTEHLPKVINGFKKATRAQIDSAGKKFALNVEETEGYLEDMTKVSSSEIFQYVLGGKHALTLYTDEKMNVKAIIFSIATEQQKLKNKIANSAPQQAAFEIAAIKDKALPEIKLTDILGNEYTSQKLKGKIVVINSWFINCKPCQIEIPELNKLVEKYKGKGVIFLALCLDNKVEIENFISKSNFDYNIIPDAKEINTKLSIQAFPANIVVDKNGIIKYATSGYSSSTVSNIENMIEQLLKG